MSKARRARAQYEREAMAALQGLVAMSPALTELQLGEVPGVARLGFAPGTVTLASVHPAQLAALNAGLPAGSPLRLVAAGRYGRYWWIELSGRERSLIVASSHLQVRVHEATTRAPERLRCDELVGASC